MLPPEDDLELLDADIQVAERRYDELGQERARVVNEPEIGQAMSRLRARIDEMRAARERLVARIAAEEETVA